MYQTLVNGFTFNRGKHEKFPLQGLTVLSQSAETMDLSLILAGSNRIWKTFFKIFAEIIG